MLASSPSYSWSPFPSSEFNALAASSYDPNSGVFTLNWAGADPDQNTGTPTGSIALVNVYVEVDGGNPTLIGQLNGGTPDGNGVYSGSTSYNALADNLPHTYSFYSVGIDDQQKAQYAPQAGPSMPDATFTETYAAPLAVQDLVVEKSIAERSYIRYLDVNFNQTAATSSDLQALASGLAGSGSSRDPYVEIVWYGENVTSNTVLGSVNLFDSGTTASVSLTGSDLSIDFGANGITSLLSGSGVSGTRGPTTKVGDGWYALGIDATGDPSHGPTFWLPFFRLLGSATGDTQVSGPYTVASTDASTVYHAEGQSGTLLNADVNGDGVVNSKDYQETLLAYTQHQTVGQGPPSQQQDPGFFPRFQLLAGAASGPAIPAPIAQDQLQALMPAAIAAWRAAGLDAADVRRLQGAAVQVGDLGTSILGVEAAGTITINRTAAGSNWYVGAGTGTGTGTAFGLVGPGGEVVAAPGSPAAGRVDLLTVLEHELGHVLGLPDNAQAGDLMDITLEPGVRRAPTGADLAAIARDNRNVVLAAAAQSLYNGVAGSAPEQAGGHAERARDGRGQGCHGRGRQDRRRAARGRRSRPAGLAPIRRWMRPWRRSWARSVATETLGIRPRKAPSAGPRAVPRAVWSPPRRRIGDSCSRPRTAAARSLPCSPARSAVQVRHPHKVPNPPRGREANENDHHGIRPVRKDHQQ